ncbi:hybrid sensor histidine kinase/response regulator [Cupriavidus sp. SHE]|jgi:two-component system, NarL family, capsular synthesis sensor histidine kinase RcsC|uniref:Virulence sensor protein BvgS n=1 Tax=Cupriavidus metallidurans TaxID=119219 RepID=A0A482IXS1_9BURK|nr:MULTISPECIES: hybrid sensor histidine kinase/response regulator [Cupriavidus]KWR75888.1 hybrid sensor histidine kinase/response regulator [Cupriavidus sp. SHE]QBP11989.1 response regulator [Cupriavidus metallidurans]
MQQILDRTQESLAQAFASLARNARRQRQLYYATVGLLIAIVIVSAILLGGLAAAKQLDIRRSRLAQYVSAISLQLQSDASFLRRTTLSVAHYLNTRSDSPTDADLLERIRRTGVAVAPDGRYTLLVPQSTQQAWGRSLPERVWQLQQIATAALTTRLAFELDNPAYVVDANAEYAVILTPSPMSLDAVLLISEQADPVTVLRDKLVQALQAQTGQELPRSGEQVWIGPVEDPVLHSQVMTSVAATTAGDGHRPALIASSTPVNAFLSQLKRPSGPAMLLLLNRAEDRIDISPPGSSLEVAERILSRTRRLPPDTLRLGRSGLVLVQPLRQEFGSLVYFLSYGKLFSSIYHELIAIGSLSMMLIIAIVISARYLDVHLLRHGQAEATRALENETINHILVNATPIGLCIVCQQDHIIVTSNLVADTLLGFSRGATMPARIIDALRQRPSRAFSDAFGPIAQIRVPGCAHADAAQQGNSTTEAAPASKPQFLQITSAPAKYRGECVLFCAIQDVTAQQQLEQELRSAQQATEAMMRARSNFFAAMSHEIRTPLHALLGNLELLGRTPGLEAHATRLRALQSSSEGLRGIVNDILDFSKIDAGEMKLVSAPFNPLDELESLSLSCAPMVTDRPIRFYAHLSPTLNTLLRGDRMRLAQIINNLLGNAFKFTASGKITLSAEISRDAQGLATLVCRVRDTGDGMSQALASRVFQPFVQGETSTTAHYSGTGLGLSICARLSELMGGHISVESVEGVGSAFTVVIPFAEPAATAPSHGLTMLGGMVMVLCQETESGATLEEWLTRVGCQVHVLPASCAAHTWLCTSHPQIMVVTGEYGLDTIRSLRTICPANAVWITRNGPDRPAELESGIFEVSAYSHAALLAGVKAALIGPPRLIETTNGTADAIGNARPEAAPNSPHQHGTVLVAEDNPLNRMLIAEQLETIGWASIVVNDGRQALAVLDQRVVDIVLTDIQMPVMNGYELLSAIKAKRPPLPVFAFSAVTHTGQASDWQARGFDGYIAKPVSLAELEHALHGVSSQPAVDATRSTPASTGSPADIVAAADRERYLALLREHLQTDEPKLAGILLSRNTQALGQWAHRCAGAFLIVGATTIVKLCRAVERLCDDGNGWSPPLETEARALQAAVHDFRASPDQPEETSTT